MSNGESRTFVVSAGNLEETFTVTCNRPVTVNKTIEFSQSSLTVSDYDVAHVVDVIYCENGVRVYGGYGTKWTLDIPTLSGNHAGILIGEVGSDRESVEVTGQFMQLKNSATMGICARTLDSSASAMLFVTKPDANLTNIWIKADPNEITYTSGNTYVYLKGNITGIGGDVDLDFSESVSSGELIRNQTISILNGNHNVLSERDFVASDSPLSYSSIVSMFGSNLSSVAYVRISVQVENPANTSVTLSASYDIPFTYHNPSYH